MARARNIKPSFFINEDLVELPFASRLLFIGLWTIADRAGRLHDRPKTIKMAIFPCDRVDVDKALNDLSEKGFIVRYVVDDTRFIQIVNFVKHQNPHIKEIASTIPAPEMHSANTVQAHLNPESLLLNPESIYLNPESIVGADSPNGEIAQPKPVRPKKEGDPRKDHAAVKIVHEILARWPHKDLWDRIIRELGDDPDAEFFRSCYEIWRSVNGNPMNLEKWLFEPARTHIKPEIYESKGAQPPGQLFTNRPYRASSLERILATRATLLQYPTEAELAAKCRTCFDIGEFESVPCPDCKPKGE